jgi:hypothetical protein
MGNLDGSQGTSRKNVAMIVLGGAVLVALWAAIIVLVGGVGDRPSTAAAPPRQAGAEEQPPASEPALRSREDRSAPPGERKPENDGSKEEQHAHGGDSEVPIPEELGGEDAVHDPLGTGAKAGDLTQRDKLRLEAAAASFATYAYGYTGDDEGRYLSGVNRAVDISTFYSSPGGEAVKEYAGQVAESGVKSRAALEGFEITARDGDKVTAVATITIGESFGEGGSIEGDVRTVRQRLELVRWGSTWKVSAAEAPQEV